MSPPPPLPLALAAGLLILLSAAGYGLAVQRWTLREAGPKALRGPLAIALGLGTMAYLTLALGLLGQLGAAQIWTLVILGTVLLGSTVRFRSWRPVYPTWRLDPGTLLWLLVATIAGLTLLESQRPVDGLDWDSLSYHLAAPKLYLQAGRIGFIAYDSHTQFPFTMEMLYTLGLAIGADGAARLLHWACGWLTALALSAWTAERCRDLKLEASWAPPLAALGFATAPVVLWEMGTAYVELGSALFQLLSLLLIADLFARPAVSSVRQLVMAGVLTGFALGTKMTALLHGAQLGLIVLLSFRELGARQGLRHLTAFGLTAALVGAPWYLKSWLWTGNPVYPFFFSLFPNSYSWTAEAAQAYASEQSSFGVGKGLRELVLAPWNLAMHARHFYINLRSLTGDRLGTIGPLVPCLLPALWWGLPRCRRSRVLLLYAALSLGAWFLLSHQVRYLVPVLAPLAAVLAVALAGLPTAPLRRAGLAAAAACIALSLQTHLPLAQSTLPVVLQPGRREEYLRSSLEGLYEAALYSRGLPPGSRIAFYQETRGYYFERPYFWANPLQHNLIPYERLETGRQLVEDLARFGITHVLINYSFCRGVEEARWYRLLMDAIGQGVLAPRFASDGAVPGRRGVVVYEAQR